MVRAKKGAQVAGRKKLRVQYGALPYHFTNEGKAEILLVTTRTTKRWIIPKGWPIKGMTPSQSAAREAYEEAGVHGAIRTKAIGSFIYDKKLDDEGVTVPCEVKVFPLLVRGQAKTWPESRERNCRWFSLSQALKAVSSKDLRTLVLTFFSRRRTTFPDKFVPVQFHQK